MKATLLKWFGQATSNTLLGGIALPRNKPGLPSDGIIRTLPIPNVVSIPLLNYQREILSPLVSVGQKIKAADALAPGIVASCSGVVTAIADQVVNHPSKHLVPCVVITTDNAVLQNTAVYAEQAAATFDRISECAVYGLGGAGFKTADKLSDFLDPDSSIDTLVINAVECEPLISCDEALMLSQADDIINAVVSLIALTGCNRCLFAIENDKTNAIGLLQKAIEQHTTLTKLELILLPPVYPAGAERPLVERLTGLSIPADSYPGEFGIVCLNVSTALAVEQARKGYPMLSRVVTIAGDLAPHPTNVRVAFGSSVADVLRLSNNNVDGLNVTVRLGGPLSGFVISDLSIPITATTNCITLEQSNTAQTQQPCIKCSACSDVCPVGLLPQQLHQFSCNENTSKAIQFGLTTCIECGCCDLVCPSNIALTQSFRFSKGLYKDQLREDELASLAEARFEQREQRQTQRDEIKRLKREAAQSRLSTSSDPMADALARAKSRRSQKRSPPNHSDEQGATPTPSNGTTPPKDELT